MQREFVERGFLWHLECICLCIIGAQLDVRPFAFHEFVSLRVADVGGPPSDQLLVLVPLVLDEGLGPFQHRLQVVIDLLGRAIFLEHPYL